MIPCLFADHGVVAIDWATACRELAGRDLPLGRRTARVGGTGFVPQPSSGTFESLARSIVYQQLSGKAAGTIFGRFRALYGDDGFPAPEAVLATPHPRLRSAGLSEAKARAVRDLAPSTGSTAFPPPRRGSPRPTPGSAARGSPKPRLAPSATSRPLRRRRLPRARGGARHAPSPAPERGALRSQGSRRPRPRRPRGAGGDPLG